MTRLLLNALIGFLVTASAFFGVNLLLVLSARGSLRAVITARRVRHVLQAGRSGAILQCRGREVSEVWYDPALDRDSVTLIYKAPHLSPLSWRSGQRSVEQVRPRAQAELYLCVGLFSLITVPILAAGIGLSVWRPGIWLPELLALIAVYAVQMRTNKYILIKYGALTPLVPMVILHRYHLYSLFVTNIIAMAWIIVSMVFLGFLAGMDGHGLDDL